MNNIEPPKFYTKVKHTYDILSNYNSETIIKAIQYILNLHKIPCEHYDFNITFSSFSEKANPELGIPEFKYTGITTVSGITQYGWNSYNVDINSNGILIKDMSHLNGDITLPIDYLLEIKNKIN